MKMNPGTIENIAQTCSAESFVGLLKEWGHVSFGGMWSSVTTGADIIAEAIKGTNPFVTERDEKQKRFAEYAAKQGPFAETRKISPDAEKELRATIEELTERVEALEKLLKPSAPKTLKPGSQRPSRPPVP
jgi:hypothetical protein